jgi:bisphosphoglycerate-independent phosphoglycerate mutase (AlkP superfamily)
MPRLVWTPEKDAQLLSYYKHGLRPAYMAEQMGMTIASVEGRYYKLKRAHKHEQQKLTAPPVCPR